MEGDRAGCVGDPGPKRPARRPGRSRAAMSSGPGSAVSGTALGAAGDDELVEVPASVDASALLELLLDELLLDELPEVSGASVVVDGAVVVGRWWSSGPW